MMDGSSSKAALMFSIGPPPEGIRAIAVFRNEYGRVIAEAKAICDPSGDHTGPASDPSCVTSGATLASATVTTEMSAVTPAVFDGLMRWSNAICAPLGDQLNWPTVNGPRVSRRVFCVAMSKTQRCDIR